MSAYSSGYIRTSMALDTRTLGLMEELAKRWSISKAEVMRRGVQRLKEDADRDDRRPSPLVALQWLQDGGGLTVAEGEEFKSAVQEERDARRYWWEE